MTTQRLIQLADKFADKTEYTQILDPNPKTPSKSDLDQKFQFQRSQFFKLAEMFRDKLRSVINEMDGDYVALKERDFDPKMLKLFGQVKWHLIEIYKKISEDKPYQSAEKLIEYVNSRHTRAVIDNLEFLIQHHLQQTAVSFTPSQHMENLKVKSLQHLIDLANGLKLFMEKNPLLPEPVIPTNVKVEPVIPFSDEEGSKPGIPEGKTVGGIPSAKKAV